MKKSLCFMLLVSSLAWADDPKPAVPSKEAQPPKEVKPEVKPRLPLVLPRPAQPGVIQDRPATVKRAVDLHQARCVKYFDDLARANSAEDKAKIQSIPPTPKTMLTMLGRVVAADAKDDAAFDALAIMAKYADIPSLEDAMGKMPGATADAPSTKIDPLALLLAHHVSNAKLADVAMSLPAGETSSKFLNDVFAKTFNPEVKGKIGYKLGTEQMRSNEAAAEKILQLLVDDKYMDGVKVNVRQTVREWADANLREIKLLGIGKVLPDVGGETLDGKKSSINDYRGKVVVLDVWATWCGPCRAMIPHEREMVKKLDGKPFVLLSVSCDEVKDTLTEFLKKEEMPWQHWWVGKGGDFSKTMNIRFYPTIYVLDTKGTIRHKNIRGEKLEEAVVKLLEEVK